MLRNQEKYQFRYDVSHSSGRHAPKFGINFIHEPVLSGALSGTEESFHQFGLNPTDYLNNVPQFQVDYTESDRRRAGRARAVRRMAPSGRRRRLRARGGVDT